MKETPYLLGYVLASKYRKNVLLALKDKPTTPARISERTSIYPSHVSNTLNELTEKHLVICLTPKLRKGRLYSLTKEGKVILGNL